MKERNVDDGQIININRCGFLIVPASKQRKHPVGEDSCFCVRSACLINPSPSTCSMSGHRVVHSADTHFYSCTKFAVTALTEGLRQELREANTHIRATVRPTLCLLYIRDCAIAESPKSRCWTHVDATAAHGNHPMLRDRNTMSTHVGNVERSISFDANSFLECLLAEHLSWCGANWICSATL